MSSHLIRIFNWSNNFTPIPVAARSKQRVYGCSPAVMAGSNPAGARISVSCECYVLFTYRPISRPGESYRAGMCHWVWSRTVFTLCTYSTYVEESRLKEIIILLKTLCLWISNSTFPVLSRLTRIEKAVKNTTIIVIYRVLVYIQMSQPTTCFGLFYLGHLQVGYLGQRKCTIVQYNHWIRGGGTRSRLQNVNNAYFNTTSSYTRPIFANEISSPPDFSGYIALLYIFPDQGIQPEDGLTRRGRNM